MIQNLAKSEEKLLAQLALNLNKRFSQFLKKVPCSQNPHTRIFGTRSITMPKSLNVTVYMHNQGDLELLTLWIVGKGGKCHKKKSPLRLLSLFNPLHRYDRFNDRIEWKPRKKICIFGFAIHSGYFRIRHFFFIPRQQLC